MIKRLLLGMFLLCAVAQVSATTPKPTPAQGSIWYLVPAAVGGVLAYYQSKAGNAKFAGYDLLMAGGGALAAGYLGREFAHQNATKSGVVYLILYGLVRALVRNNAIA